MFPFCSKHYIYDIETTGIDSETKIFISERVFHPSIQFKPFRIKLWRIVNTRELTKKETDEIINEKLKKFYNNLKKRINI